LDTEPDIIVEPIVEEVDTNTPGLESDAAFILRLSSYLDAWQIATPTWARPVAVHDYGDGRFVVLTQYGSPVDSRYIYVNDTHKLFVWDFRATSVPLSTPYRLTYTQWVQGGRVFT
jgi:hypothetical protein